MRLRASLLAATFALTAHAAEPLAPTPTPLAADSLQNAAALRDQHVEAGAAYAIVESLTTEVGPRMAGTPADARAVEWAQQKFKALGFDEVRIEPFKFPYWRRGHERGEVLAPFPQPLAITALGGSIGTGGAPLEAEILAFDSIAALQAAPEGAAAGRIVFITQRTQRARDGRGYGLSVIGRSSGAVEAAKKGAVGLIIRSISTNTDRFPHTGIMRYADGVNQIPAAAVSNPDADLLTRMLERGQPVRIRLDIDAENRGEATSYNVIGDIRGRERPDEVVVIGGHLDSWDLGTGALDDGAGVGITMAAGAALLKLEQRPLRTVRVIAWGNEEQGLIGARAYAALHAEQMANHVIGAESDFGAGRIYALRAGVEPAYWPLLEQIAGVLTPLGIPFEREGGGPGPDIGPLVQRGVPWAQLAQDGMDYFDYHHTANDTLDKIDSEALDQQARAYAVFAYLAAEAEGGFGRARKQP
ncbi:MAG: M20/M25/M40 family metallo-hydrolase [Xanthomonadales bacterium]|nr:M20/M25/M40 family metallo-hydrolase [Xanthomonadales bacterium]